jgi:hypothetical protein
VEDESQQDQLAYVILAASANSEKHEQAEEAAQVEEMMAMVEAMEAYPQEGEDQYLKDVGQMLTTYYHFALVGIWY